MQDFRLEQLRLHFDDGYQDNLDVAAPILLRMGLPATFFLVPEFLSRQRTAWWETLGWAMEHSERPHIKWGDYEHPLSGSERQNSYVSLLAQLKKIGDADRQDTLTKLVEELEPAGESPVPTMFMDWSGAQTLKRKGFSIGSHTLRHVILSNETAERQSEDLRGARAELAARLGGDVDILAYPNGGRRDYNRASVDAARMAGYRAAVTTVEGFNQSKTSRFELRRVCCRSRMGLQGRRARAAIYRSSVV